MALVILLPAAWKPWVGETRQLLEPQAHVADLLLVLRQKFPSLEPLIRSAQIFVQDEQVGHLQGLQTPLQDGDTVRLVAAPMPDQPLDLSADEVRRYARQMVLPAFGKEGQLRLKASRVLLVGAGGLGSPTALYLAAAGVGTLGIVDGDVVDVSNLHRQILHGTSQVGQPKVESARARLLDLNPHIQVKTYPERITAANALRFIEPYDLVLDGADNFSTRYLVNDACVMLGKPDVQASVLRSEGQLSVFWASKGPCYRCIFPEPPPPGTIPDCATGGVLGVLPGILGLLQATEALKILLGQGDLLIGRLLLVDAWRMHFHELQLAKDPDCPLCGKNRLITDLKDLDLTCTTSTRENLMADITPRDVNRELQAGKKLVLLDVREPQETSVSALPGAVIIPLGQLPARLNELSKAADIVVYCRAGGRSAKATALLTKEGFTRVRNMTGGIIAWHQQIDPSLPYL